MTTRTIQVHFEPRLRDSDGRERTRGHGLNVYGAQVQRWKVFDLAGEYAIHVRVDYPMSSKPRKDFRWKHPDGRTSRYGEISSTDRLYGLELVNGQRKGLLVEGERCADAARAVLPASWWVGATVCGAYAIPDAAVLARIAAVPRLYVWPDADANGRGQEHMASISAYLKHRCQVRTVHWHAAPPGGDVADYLKSHSRGELLGLLKDAK